MLVSPHPDSKVSKVAFVLGFILYVHEVALNTRDGNVGFSSPRLKVANAVTTFVLGFMLPVHEVVLNAHAFTDEGTQGLKG